MLPTPGKERGCLAYSILCCQLEKKVEETLFYLLRIIKQCNISSFGSPSLTQSSPKKKSLITRWFSHSSQQKRKWKEDHIRKMNNAGFPKLHHCIRGSFHFLNIQYDVLQLLHVTFLLQFFVHSYSQEKFPTEFYDTTNSTLK